MWKQKKISLAELEEGLGAETVDRLRTNSELADGSQFRPRAIEQLTRASILRLLQEEDGEYGSEYGSLSIRATRSVNINKALELELRQIQFKHRRDTQPVTTDIQWNKLQQSRRKLSQAIDGWFRKLGDFMPVEAVDELRTMLDWALRIMRLLKANSGLDKPMMP
ncbi:hypothetical protein M422DRAFT_56216 [Sphaerobolus stellatus SS14]|uniref:Uncharacterized protein n=1 Tax=Sphaerobolus stellatus (strain SS14) TaxID=990650 RepID=A0A0C9UHM9_SPHS4|nr:hypothetical protein M422DRAFT_56216 [Sphaerobolus stellatus SS14]